MADTMRSDFPDKYCAHCGKKGDCYIKHWGPLMGYKVVYLDRCIMDLPDNSIQIYDCNTGQNWRSLASFVGHRLR